MHSESSGMRISHGEVRGKSSTHFDGVADNLRSHHRG
jgi:hypothetical protein